MKKLLCIVLILLLIPLLFWWKQTEKNRPLVIRLQIKDKKLVNSDTTILVPKDRSVIFRIVSDSDDSFHIEGYHAFTPLQKDSLAILSLQALTAGRFPIILDTSKTFLGTLQVGDN